MNRLRNTYRFAQDYWTIKQSGAFDPIFYLTNYPDVCQADISPLYHYVKYGWIEGRNPSPKFDTRFYLEKYPDVAVSGINPFAHYLRYGSKEDRIGRPTHMSMSDNVDYAELSIPSDSEKKSFSIQPYLQLFFDLVIKSISILIKRGPKGLILKVIEYRGKRRKTKSSSNGISYYATQYKEIFSGVIENKKLLSNDPSLVLTKLRSTVIEAYHLPPQQNPLVSIIIPTYNHLNDTLKCLYSIAAANEKTSYEIIVADDTSTDETVATLAPCKGIRLIKNATNLGFLRTCNAAAKETRGQYILLLNNDTAVLPGWLDHLVETFANFPETGLVGSKLIYPDGRLQEAGGIIWNDGSGLNYGKFDNPLRPQYNYLREVDYCSGACIAIKKELWEKLGGFDESFAPAYYEDTDLAFRVRQAGYSVLYQPLSQIFHAEGVSSGTDINKGVKRYQEINKEKFIQRWGKQLESHGKIGETAEKIYRNRYRKLKALIIDTITPTPDQDSGSMDTVNYLKTLRSLGFDVCFVADNNFYPFDKYVCNLQKYGIQCQYYPFTSSVPEFIKYDGQDFDIIFIFRAPDHERYIPLIRKFAPQAKIIFNTVDLHFLRIEREAKLNKEKQKVLHDKAELLKQIELFMIKGSDRTIVVSEKEYQLLQEIDPYIKVTVLPIPREIPGRLNGFEGRKDILFLGGFNHQPNSDAVEYFVKEIWPVLSENLPECKFLIAGSNIPQKITQLANDRIKVLGFVEDLTPLYASCMLSVAPLRYGAGVKGKIVTSLSYGVPCITTSVGAEGMALIPNENILIGDSPEEFSRLAARVYTDPELWEKLSLSGLSIVKERYSLEKFRSDLKNLLLGLGITTN